MSRDFLRKAMGWIPTPLRHKIWREMIKVPQDKEIQLTLAQTPEDFEAAFRILYDCYVESGSEAPHPSQLRVTPYHLLPTTHVLLAKVKGEIIGTVSIITDGAFGLPISKVCDLRPLKLLSPRIAEISSLAIKKEARKAHGAAMFPLFKGVFEYCAGYLGIDILTVTVKLFRRDLYEGLIGFQPITGEVIEGYNFSNGATVFGEYLDLRTADKWMTKAYKGSSKESNLYQYFTFDPIINLDELRKAYAITDRPLMATSVVEEFFVQKQPVIQNLSQDQLFFLSELYRDFQDTVSLFKEHVKVRYLRPARKKRRFSINNKAQLLVGANQVIDLIVKDVSADGLKIWIPDEMAWEQLKNNPCKIHFMNVSFNSLRPISVEIEINHSETHERSFGCRVLSKDKNWAHLVQFIENYEPTQKIKHLKAG